MSEPDDVQTLIKLLDPRLAGDQTDLYRRALEQFDRVILRRALERCEGNLTRAAALLGLSRVTLRSKLRALGLAGGKGTAVEPTNGSASSIPPENAPPTHPGIPEGPTTPLNPGQDLTRTDEPGAGPSEPHLGDTVARRSAGLHNI
jgi:DNA-binding protein Fis